MMSKKKEKIQTVSFYSCGNLTFSIFRTTSHLRVPALLQLWRKGSRVPDGSQWGLGTHSGCETAQEEVLLQPASRGHMQSPQQRLNRANMLLFPGQRLPDLQPVGEWGAICFTYKFLGIFYIWKQTSLPIQPEWKSYTLPLLKALLGLERRLSS